MGLLLLGDCLDVLATLPAASVDMIFADLPYSHVSGKKIRKCTENDWDVPIDLSRLWLEFFRAGKVNAAIAFTATQPFASHLIVSQSKHFRYDLIWHKTKVTGFLNARRAHLRAHEHILIFARKQPTYNPQFTYGHTPYGVRKNGLTRNYATWDNAARPANEGKRYPQSVYRCTGVKGQEILHPTQKPVALLEWLIKTYTHEGDTVLDPTCGSGTTAIAAINTNREWVCIEKDADYHATAARRIAEHQTKPKQSTLAI